MVALNLTEDDPTLLAIKDILEKAEGLKERRGYLGASGIGHPCERQVWYQYNGYPYEPMGIKGIYAVEDGHRSEELLASRLKLVPGVQLATLDENGNQFGFSKFDGKFKGHIDGLIIGLLQAPKTAHIWEAKSVNEKKFGELQKLIEKFGEKNALKEWDYIFYIQSQIYMGEFDLDRHYLTACTPGGRDIISVRTEFDRNIYKATLSKAERIINAKNPPERAFHSKTWKDCRWCKFAEECWKVSDM